MVEIVNTPCSWIITRCADKSTTEYTKYIYIAISTHTHMHARTHKQMHARTHTSLTSLPSAFLSYLILSYSVLPSFPPLQHFIYPSLHPFHRKIKSGTQGRNNPPNKGSKRTRGETTRIKSYRQIYSHQFIMVTPAL